MRRFASLSIVSIAFDTAEIRRMNRASGSVHTTQGELEKRALFLPLVRPTVHTNPSPNWSFLKTLFQLEEFENRPFENDDVMIITWSPWPSSGLKHKSKRLVILEFSNSSGVVWTEDIWCVFREKPPFSISAGVMWTEPSDTIKMDLVNRLR